MSQDNKITSTINKNVKYSTSKKIHPEDIDSEVTTYDTNLFDDLSVELAMGNKNLAFSAKYGIVYFPLYLILHDKPIAKVAIFEVKSDDLITLLDDDQDVDITKGGHILPIVSRRYIERAIRKAEEALDKGADTETVGKSEEEEKGARGKSEEEEKGKTGDGAKEEEEEDSVFHFRAVPSAQSKKANDTLKSGLFTRNAAIDPPPLLEQESEADATKWNNEFTESSGNQWIETFMKNHNYHIEENEGGGDCFFAVIRDAFKSYGQETTVAKLRALLAKEMTEELYTTYHSLFLSVRSELAEVVIRKKECIDNLELLKKRSRSSKSKVEAETLVKEASALGKRCDKIEKEKATLAQFYEDVRFMESIESIEQLREYMLTSDYWVDEWGISTIERILNIKMIVLSEELYKNKTLYARDPDSVLQCGSISEHVVEQQANYKPDFYVMTTFSGDHYKLIKYKNKKMLKFSELPYSIKVLILNKCMEKNSGSFYLIKDFRDLKVRLGLHPNLGSNEGNDEGEGVDEDQAHTDLYDKDIVFMFHSKSNAGPKPGKGSGEQIPASRATEFIQLHTIPEWREKLDDSWMVPLTIDKHRWNSVEHYILGSQYKKGFPDFYLKFSVDSGSDISQDLTLARAACGDSGKYKGRVLREKGITVDADYYEVGVDQRSVRERIIALEAKFLKNLDFKELLAETKTAKLTHFIRRAPAETDILLMKLRQTIPQKK